MPTETQWREIAGAGDLHHTIDRMRDQGLGFWVSELPRQPAIDVIERHLHSRLVAFVHALQRLLPSPWARVSQWLGLLPELKAVKALLQVEHPVFPFEASSSIHAIAQLPRPKRRAALISSRYAPLALDENESPEELWLNELKIRLPELNGREAEVIQKIEAIVQMHRVAVLHLRRRERARLLSSNGSVTDAHPEHALWSLRGELTTNLRVLLRGDPFHGGFVLIYGLLEAIQFERIRAVLLAHAHRWRSDVLLGSY